MRHCPATPSRATVTLINGSLNLTTLLGLPTRLAASQRTTPDGKRGMAEFYANEIMSHPFTFNVYGGKTAKIGVAADLTAAAAVLPVHAVKAWKMTLSSDQESLVAY